MLTNEPGATGIVGLVASLILWGAGIAVRTWHMRNKTARDVDRATLLEQLARAAAADVFATLAGSASTPAEIEQKILAQLTQIPSLPTKDGRALIRATRRALVEAAASGLFRFSTGDTPAPNANTTTQRK